MSCVPECINYYCFSDFTCDEDIVLPLTVDQEGVHTMRIEWHGQIFYNSATQLADEDTMTFLNVLNEDGTAIFQIIQPDITPYVYTVDGIAYTHFKLQNKIAVDVTPAVVAEPVEFVADC